MLLAATCRCERHAFVASAGPLGLRSWQKTDGVQLSATASAHRSVFPIDPTVTLTYDFAAFPSGLKGCRVKAIPSSGVRMKAKLLLVLFLSVVPFLSMHK
jgi:hypothetical protein